MSKSLVKAPFVAYHLLEKIEKQKNSASKNVIKTWSRSSTILPEMIGCTIGVYNGQKHISIYISDALVGHKLGEFSFTRTFSAHKKGKGEHKIKK